MMSDYIGSIYCDKCGIQLSTQNHHKVHGYLLCDKCYEKVKDKIICLQSLANEVQEKFEDYEDAKVFYAEECKRVLGK